MEITLHAVKAHSDPFNQLELDVLFTDPAGTRRVPAFWAGGDTWKARFAASRPGLVRWRSECSDKADAGLHGVTGSARVRPYRGANPLYKHGSLRVAKDHRHLEQADGTPFFWLGDTWWMGLCHRIHYPDEFGKLAADRVAKGFNVVQIVAGLYPDMPPFDPRGANEAGFPWEAGYACIRPEYFDAADKRIRYLVDHGLTPCIVGAWGYFLPWMGVEKMKKHWRYLIARWGSLPVVWCAAGEANLPWYLAKGFPYDDRQQVHGWTEVMRYIRATDPYHRLLTVHPTAIRKYTARHATDDDKLLDFDMLQTPHGRQEAVPVTVLAVRESRTEQHVMPVIDGEASYEMLSDSLPTRWTRAMFWLCMMNGAAGHTYGANGIWQCNRRGEPHGKSPHGGSYGVIPWDEAMNLPGSRQLGLGKKLLERYQWWKLEPQPKWAASAAANEVSLDAAKWIWFPEGDPRTDAPAAKRFFRLAFDLPAAPVSAHLRLTADDAAIAYVNGTKVAACEDWRAGVQTGDIARTLHAGRNLIAIAAENRPAPVTANPAGLIVALQIELADGKRLEVLSSGAWRSAKEGGEGGERPSFDDSAWVHAKEIGRYGDAPWGRAGGGAQEPPQCAAIPGGDRFLYSLRPEPMMARALEEGVSYTAHAFNPLTGETTNLGAFLPDRKGEYSFRPPAGISEDWLLILEPLGRGH